MKKAYQLFSCCDQLMSEDQEILIKAWNKTMFFFWIAGEIIQIERKFCEVDATDFDLVTAVKTVFCKICFDTITFMKE